MNYQIITDEEKLREFIDWLPELKGTEKFYCCLFARSKYTKDEAGNNEIPHIKTDKAQLKRFVSDKGRLFKKIKQLEIEEGGYWQRELVIPQKALALYITPNPRDLWKATSNSLVKLAQCIRDNNVLANPHQEVLSEIQRTRGTGYFVDFDFDIPDRTELQVAINKVYDCVNEEAVNIILTRGGAHCLVRTSEVRERYKNSFYKDLRAIPGVDQSGDTMIPVVGCYQGGFTPHFYKL